MITDCSIQKVLKLTPKTIFVSLLIITSGLSLAMSSIQRNEKKISILWYARDANGDDEASNESLSVTWDLQILVQ